MVPILAKEKSVVIDPERIAKGKLSEPAHFVYQYDIADETRGYNTFLILRTATLNRFAPLIVKALKELSKLRVVFLFKDDGGLDQFLNYVRGIDKVVRSKLLDVFYSVDSIEQVNDVMHSWCDGSQDDRIARAIVQDEQLIITTFGMKSVRVKFRDIPGLCRIPIGQRTLFVVAPHGRKMSWQQCKIDIDLDIVRYHTDPKFRRLKNFRALTIYSNLGDAIKALREQYGLTQEQICSRALLSTKQLGRFEHGEQKPTVKALHRLADGFGVSYDELIHALVKVCDQLQSKQLKALRAPDKKSTLR